MTPREDAFQWLAEFAPDDVREKLEAEIAGLESELAADRAAREQLSKALWKVREDRDRILLVSKNRERSPKYDVGHVDGMREAQDEITRLKAENERLRELGPPGTTGHTLGGLADSLEDFARLTQIQLEAEEHRARAERAEARVAELEAEVARLEGLLSAEECDTSFWKARAGWLAAENICDACAGSGKPVSGSPCMCGSTGKMSDAAIYLREQLTSETQRANRLAAVVEGAYELICHKAPLAWTRAEYHDDAHAWEIKASEWLKRATALTATPEPAKEEVR